MSRTPVVFCALLTLTSCAGEAPRTATEQGERYRTIATVLQDERHGPQFCYAVMDSYPPQCEGPDVVGWSWDGLAHESARQTRWGGYELVGTWDGARFTLTEPARPGKEKPLSRKFDFTSPCPLPSGGRKGSGSIDQREVAIARAQRHEGFAGAWVDAKNGVLVVAYTEELKERERDLRRVFGGALCVTGRDRSLAELEEIAAGWRARPGVLGSGVEPVRNKVEVSAYVIPDEWRAEAERKHGPGVVEFDGRFERIG